MASPVSQIGRIALPTAVQPANQPGKPGEFRALLEGSIQRVEHVRSEAAQAVEKLITGEEAELHSTVLAVQRAELAFELGLQIRNKVVQAYQEIMRMQI